VDAEWSYARILLAKAGSSKKRGRVVLRNNSIRKDPGFHSVALNMLIANSQVAETPGDGVLARDRLNPLAKQRG
jgi:hypothetical protein